MKISVAMATYNGSKYINEQIKSICMQSHPVDELIIVDDKSKDSTVKIIKDLIKKYSNIQIQVIENSENLGYIENFRKALRFCNGDYIFLCDQDDIWMPNKVEEMISVLEINPKIKVLGSSFSFIDGNGNDMQFHDKKNTSNHNMIDRKIINNDIVQMKTEDLIFHNYCQGCALVINKEIAEEFIRVDNKKIPHDWQISLLGSINNGTYFYNKPLFYYRIHNNNTLGVNDNLSPKEKMNVNIRISAAKEVLECVRLVEILTGDKNIHQLDMFLSKNIEMMENKSTVRLIFQMIIFNKYYSKLKSFKGRILDIIYTLSRG